MKHLWKAAMAATVLAGAVMAVSGPASARVAIGVSIGAPGYYYGPGYYPPGPCDAYSYYYDGDCGYSVYSGRVFINGAWVTGPHYYRWYGGRPLFWYRGGWHDWAGWRGARWDWNHGPGWGWRDGHWNRAWGVGGFHGGGHFHGGAHWGGHGHSTMRFHGGGAHHWGHHGGAVHHRDGGGFGGGGMHHGGGGGGVHHGEGGGHGGGEHHGGGGHHH